MDTSECLAAGLGKFFFFQAEDGIRDLTVTGVQTCALPISQEIAEAPQDMDVRAWRARVLAWSGKLPEAEKEYRSEERRVGKEGRSRWVPDHLKKKKESLLACAYLHKRS